MKNDYYNIPNDWYNTTNNPFIDNFMDINNINYNNYLNNNENINYEEGLDRGNLFDNLYRGYKNYQYRKLKANSEKENLLYTILKHKFLLTDLNLYLDIYQNNNKYLSEYNKYLNNLMKATNEYESKYGPLTTENVYFNKNNNWAWDNNQWPWEGSK